MRIEPRSPTLPVLALALALGAVSGCGKVCLIGDPSPAVVCDAGGGGTLSAPADLDLGGAVKVEGAQGCLMLDGSCSSPISFSISSGMPDPDGIFATVALPLMQGAATYHLPATGVETYAFLARRDAGTTELRVSGTIDVQGAGTTGFRASYDLDLAMPDGRILSITGGTVALTSCAIDEVCSL